MISQKKSSLLSRIFSGKSNQKEGLDNRLSEMLNIVEKMYSTVMDAIISETAEKEEIQDRVKAWDRQLGELEEAVRRDILLNISKSGSVEAGISRKITMLALVKDCERMGDYIKNIFRVFITKQKVFLDDYKPSFIEQREWTEQAFPKLKSALTDDDLAMAQTICQQAHEMSKKAGHVVDTLIKLPRSSETPVASSLMFLFHKRLLRHMFNVGSSIVMPYQKVNYFDEGKFSN